MILSSVFSRVSVVATIITLLSLIANISDGKADTLLGKGKVLPSGGMVSHREFTIVIPKYTFSKPSSVQIVTTATKEVEEDFENSIGIFGGNFKRIGMEYRILSSTLPKKDILVHIRLDPSVLKNLKAGKVPILFVQIFEEGGQEVLDNFRKVDSSYDSDRGEVTATIFSSAFTNDRRTDGLFEAIMILAIAS